MQYKVTLKKMISLYFGNHRFKKDQPVIISDKSLIKYVKGNSWFVIEELEENVESESTKEDEPPSSEVNNPLSEDDGGIGGDG